MNTWGYIEQIRENHDGCSDYRIAQVLGISRSAMSLYRSGREADDETAAKIAAELGELLWLVLANIRLSAAKQAGNDYMVKAWETALKSFGGGSVEVPPVSVVPPVAMLQTGKHSKPKNGRLDLRGKPMKRTAAGLMLAGAMLAPLAYPQTSQARGLQPVSTGQVCILC